MSVAVFIGDEVSATAYRLSGIDVFIADSRNVSSLIEASCKSASLVLLASSSAQYLSETELQKLLKNVTPPVLVVADIKADHAVPDISSLIYKQLGMME